MDHEFVMRDVLYKERNPDIKKLKLILQEFVEYLDDGVCTQELSKGLEYIFKHPCHFQSAVEAFRVHAYDVKEGENILELRKLERIAAKIAVEELRKVIINMETIKIRNDRLLRISNLEKSLNIIARSSGNSGNFYVYGYGYKYGTGYTNDTQTTIAPGFELAYPEHINNAVQTFHRKKGKKPMDQIYYDIFGFKKKKSKKID